MNEIAATTEEQSQLNTIDTAIGMVSSSSFQTQTYHSDILQPFDPLSLDINPDDDFLKEKKQQPRPGCSEATTRKSWFEELMNSSDRQGNNISAVAKDAAENVVSAKMEFLQGITLFHVKYEKTQNERWENGGRDIVELFDENKPGGERKGRYEQLKEDMAHSRFGMIFSEPTITDELNYIQRFVDNGKTVDEYIIQYWGNAEDFANLYTLIAAESNNGELNGSVDFSQPLHFDHEITMEQMVQTIDQSYVTYESRESSADYLNRLKRDVSDISLLDRYQQEAEVLARQIEQEFLSNGLSHAVLDSLAQGLDDYAKGGTLRVDYVVQDTVETMTDAIGNLAVDTSQTITDIMDYVQARTEKDQDKNSEALAADEKSIQILRDLTDGALDEKTLELLSQPDSQKNPKDSDLFMRWKHVAQKELHITQKQSELLLEETQQTWTKMQNASEVIAFVDQTGIGFGAAIQIVDSFAGFDIDTLSLFLRETQSIYVPEVYTEKNGVVVLQHDALREMIDQIIEESGGMKLTLSEQKESNLSKQKEKSPINDVVVGWVKEFVRAFDKKTPQEAIIIIESEEKRVIQTTELLWEVLEEFLTNEELSSSEKETSEKETDQPIREFSFAVMIWAMMQLDSYLQVLHSMKDTLAEIVLLMKDPETKTTLKQKASSLFKKHLSEGLVKQEGSSWLLFAIIWYLAMIREQGVVGVVNNQKPVKKKKAVLLRQLYPSGIIFAFGS